MKKLVLLLLTWIAASTAFALSHDHSECLDYDEHGYCLYHASDLAPEVFVLTLSGGLAFAYPGQAQTLFLSPSIEKYYTANSTNQLMASGELFFGLQQTWTPHFQTQIGLAFGGTDNAKVSGDIWDDGLAMFDNYTYQYKVSNVHLSLKGKMLGNWGWKYKPWISASIGAAWNRAYDFSNTPSIYEALPTPNFANKTSNAFTYSLGFGVDYRWNNEWSIGLGYEFADWGKSELGSASGQTTGQGLAMQHVYTQSLLVNLSYFN